MTFFKNGELKHLGIFYLEKFISSLLFFAPAFWILQFNQNLNLFQIGILFSVLSITSFLFEIPTGAFADIYGRKASVLFSYFLTAITLIFLAFVTNFYILVLIFAIWGIANTFSSGAKESWVIDNLKFNKKEKLINHFYIKQQSIIGFSLVISGILGYFLVGKFDLSIIWVFASISFLISGFMLLFVKEHKLTKEKKKTFKQLFIQSKKSIKFALNHYTIMLILMATFFIMFRDSFGGDLVWQPFLNSLGFPIASFGFLFSIITLVSAIATLFANKLLNTFKNERNYLIFLLICSMILDFLVFFVNNYYLGIILLILMLVSISLFMPIGHSYFQKFIPSRMRATITSFNGMIISLAYAISYPLSGFLADTITTKYTIILGGLFLIPSLIFYLKIKNK